MALGSSGRSGRTRVHADSCGSGGTSGGTGWGGGGGASTPFGSGATDSSYNSMGSSVGPNTGSGFNIDRYNPIYDQLEEGTILEDWIPRDAAGLDLLFRRIYLRDPTIGPGIDILRSLPWSEYHLESIDDKEIMKVYQDCIEALHVQLLMPDITGDYLVIGRNISSLIFDSRKGIFSGVVPHDPDFLKISPLPVYGFDPLCDFKISPGFRKFLSSTDPRAIDARKSLPPSFLDAAKKNQGFLPLDPVSTIYLARKASQHDSIGTSLLTRTLYFWAIEKALLNATLASTRRRARSFMHLTAGIDGTWEPRPEELDALAGMAMQVNEDPAGGVMATRTGVTISEPVGGGADFYKWSDELELFAKYKMQSIGISDALLNGESTYSNQEQARSVLVESLATLRARLVHKFFDEKLWPTIARLHGFVKRSQAELNHKIRTTSPLDAFRQYQANGSMPSWAHLTNVTAQKLTLRQSMSTPVGDLIIPTINWAKQLKPTQDEAALDVLEKLKNNEYPTTLAQWATASGYNPKTVKSEAEEDIKVRNELKKYEESLSGAAEGGEEPPEASDEQPSGEGTTEEAGGVEIPTGASVYAKVRRAVQGKAQKVDDLPIWHNSKCGPLRKTEASKVLASLRTDFNSEIFKDLQGLKQVLNQKLGGEKGEIMSYVISRLNLAPLPVSPKAAQVIAQSARSRMNRHSSFSSEQALLDVRRYETEIRFLMSLEKRKGITRSSFKPDIVPPTNELGKKLLSGYF